MPALCRSIYYTSKIINFIFTRWSHSYFTLKIQCSFSFSNKPLPLSAKFNSKTQHNHVTVCTGCLSGLWPRKQLTWRTEATDRCLSSNIAFIKASAGSEYRSGLCLHPPAAIKTAKSQAREELKQYSSITDLTLLDNSQLWVLNHLIRSIHHCYLYHPCED